MLKQEKSFAKKHLMNDIEDINVHDKWALKKALHKEPEWALKNPWKMSLPRLEARQYIDNYGDNDVWIGKSIYMMYNINNSKYLELVTLENNKLHAMPTREANSIIQSNHVIREKPALEHALLRTLKQVFMGVYNSMNELAIEANNAHGKDVFPYLYNLRKLQVQEYLNAKVRKDVKQIASFKGHAEQVKKGVAVYIRLLPSMFLMGNVITKNIKHLDHRS
ncbi:hypothetical protein KSP40_PGU017278 [Platanthera guangdongensis]|uniref:Uncharacterized protein n=1 Tax=Platanthera guangdongensis TaxID=2320717 RepID=A0ABR2MRJ2_9ASPA